MNRWRPPQYSSQTKGVLLCANSEGSISQWHVPTGRILYFYEIFEFMRKIIFSN